MSIVITTPPAAEPLTLEEAKVQVAADDGDNDVMIASLIVAARQHVESRIQRGLLTQTRELRLDCFPPVIVLREGLLQSVSSIQYVDGDGQTQTLATSAYQVDPQSEPPRIAPAFGTIWPSTRRQMNAVMVTYVCGYASINAVPEQIKAAMKLIVGDLYANRENSVVGATYIETPAVAGMLADYVSYAS